VCASVVGMSDWASGVGCMGGVVVVVVEWLAY